MLGDSGKAPSLLNGSAFSPLVDVVLVTSLVGLGALALEATSAKPCSVEEIDALRQPRLSPMLKSALREAQKQRHEKRSMTGTSLQRQSGHGGHSGHCRAGGHHWRGDLLFFRP